MQTVTPSDLRSSFLECAAAHLKAIKDSVLSCADSYASFEGWLNWELALAMQRKLEYPDYSTFREYRLTGDNRLADIAIFQGAGGGKHIHEGARVETKLVWANGNANKQLASAASDFENMSKTGGVALLVTVIVCAGKQTPILEPTDPALLIQNLEVKLARFGVRAGEGVTLLSAEASGGNWWMDPRVRVVAHRVG